MDFSLSEAGEDLRSLTADIAVKISTPERVADLEAARAPLDADLWHELATAGLLGLELPSSVVGEAGGDLGAVENVTVAAQLGEHLARVPFGAHAIAAGPLIAARGSDALRGAVLPGVADGTGVLTLALEEDLGTDPLAPAVTLSGGKLDGAKLNVPYAAAATGFLVSAAGPDGVVAVYVDAASNGVRITDTPVTGLTPTGEVEFSNVAVDDAHVLSGGRGAVVELVDRARLAVAAEQSGVVRRALELTAEYAREREQFGRPIGSFQAVAQRLADGYIDAQALSLTTTQAAWMLGELDGAGSPGSSDEITRESVGTAIATAKFWAAEAGHRVAHTAVHVHGGVGLDTSHPVHRYFLRAKQNEFTLGAVPVALGDIGSVLAAEPVA